VTGRARVAVGLMLAGLLLVPVAGRAQGPPIHTDTPIMLGLDGRGVRTFLKVVRMNELLRDGTRISDPLDRTMTALVYPIVVPVNLTPTTQIGVIAPFVTRRLESNAGDVSSSGPGDATVFLKQLLVQVDRRAETFRLAVKGGVKLPTGDETGPLALGSGSVDYRFNALAGWIKSRWGFYGEAGYALNTNGAGVERGDRFAYNAAVGYRLLPAHYTHYPQPQLNIYLELNGSVAGRSTAGGAENPDTGGSLLLLSPGVQYVGGRRWLLEASVQVPVLDEPNGTQLGTGWAAILGTRVLVF